jgi:hypothetical protein
MLCYECAIQGVRREAVGMCHHCSAGLCEEHAHVEASPIKAVRQNPTFGAVARQFELALPARRLLCSVCQTALHQDDARLEASRAPDVAPNRQHSLYKSAA